MLTARLSLVASLTLIAGCSFHIDKTSESTTPSEASSNFEKGLLTGGRIPSWGEVKTQVFDRSCVECHDSAGRSKGGISLNTFELTRQAISAIERSVFVENSMPPQGRTPLTDSQKLIIERWIRGGALLEASSDAPQENIGGHDAFSPSPTPTPTPAMPAPVSWKRVWTTVIEPRCAGCHDGTGRSELLIQNLQQVRESADSIKEEVFEKKSMPPRRKGPLTEEQWALLKQWFDSGMPEDPLD